MLRDPARITTEYRRRLDEARQRGADGPDLVAAEAQLKALQDEAALHTTLSLVIGRLEDFARRVQDRVADADWDMRRELIRLLVKRVEIGCDDVNIVFRINPAPLPSNSGGPSDGGVLQDCGRLDHGPAGRMGRGVTESPTHIGEPIQKASDERADLSHIGSE